MHTDGFSTQPLPSAVRTYDAPTTEAAPVVDGGRLAVIDQVRWGPVMAGLFTAISTLALLSLLGLAAGSGIVDTTTEARRVAIGTGMWTALSALISFFAGGWVAARLAALRDERHALIHGALVWAVAVPLLLYVLSGGLGSLLNTADAAVAAQVAADGTSVTTTQPTPNGVVAPDQTTVATVADGVSKAAWGVLASLLFALSAATFGGWVAARRSDPHHDHTRRPRFA